MGVLLFDRSISPIEITEFGKAYLEYAEDVISATDRLNDDYVRFAGFEKREK